MLSCSIKRTHLPLWMSLNGRCFKWANFQISDSLYAQVCDGIVYNRQFHKAFWLFSWTFVNLSLDMRNTSFFRKLSNVDRCYRFSWVSIYFWFLVTLIISFVQHYLVCLLEQRFLTKFVSTSNWRRTDIGSGSYNTSHPFGKMF